MLRHDTPQYVEKTPTSSEVHLTFQHEHVCSCYQRRLLDTVLTYIKQSISRLRAGSSWIAQAARSNPTQSALHRAVDGYASQVDANSPVKNEH
jgi:hypothetical protein